MNFPATSEALRAAGYVDMERSKFCACGEVVFWFLTRSAKWMPMAMDADGRWTPHWANCRQVKSQQKIERKKQAAKQGILFT